MVWAAATAIIRSQIRGDDGDHYNFNNNDVIFSPFKATSSQTSSMTPLAGFCPAPGCRKRHSPLHGFFLCPKVQKNVIVPCQDILRFRLVTSRSCTIDDTACERALSQC